MGQVAHPVGPHQSQVHAGGDSPQSGRGADKFIAVLPFVERGAAVGDVAESVFARHLGRGNPEQPRRVLHDQGFVVATGDEAAVTTAKTHVHSKRLDVAAGDVGAIGRRWSDQAEATRIDTDDQHGAVCVDGGCDRSTVQNHAQVRGVVQEQAGDAVVQQPGKLTQIQCPGLGVATNPAKLEVAAAVVGHHRPFFGIDMLGDQHHPAPRVAPGHAHGRRRGLVPVEGRDADHLHLEQLAHHAGVFEQRLEPARIVVRFARVCGQVFAASVDFVANRGNVVLVAAAAEKAQRIAAWPVPGQQTLDVSLEAVLRDKRGRQIQGALHPQLSGNVGVEFVDRGCADRRKHLRLNGRNRVRYIGVDGRRGRHAQ